MDIAILTTAAFGGLPCSLWISRSVTPFPEEFHEARQGLGHGLGYLFDEAGQVYVPFRQACTLMGAQGDVDLKQSQRLGPADSTDFTEEQESY